jgi:uncharacterized protein YoxC
MMDNEQLAIKLQETTDRSLRNEGRIKKLEGEHETLQQLATSVAVMAEQMKTMNTNVNSLASKVEHLEEKPAKRWDAVVDKLVWAILAAIVAYALGSIGL